MAFDADFTEQVRENCNFEELIEAHCQGIRRLGPAKAVALCPFHHEKTPSFHVDYALKRYYCFGCKEKGDVFSFVMATEHVDFPDAVRFLARRCGMPEPEYRTSDPAARSAIRRKKEKNERLFEINEFACGFFQELLRRHPDSPVARYLARRGIPAEYADRFRIGAAPEGWDTLLSLGRKKGYSDEELVESGLVVRNEERESLYDRFRSRLVFPIWDNTGRVAGFSARTILAGDSDGAKYVNTPETPIFHKGALLYAFPLALKGFREHGVAILCEGQLDTMAFFRSGLPCAVAPQGTGFTQEQAKLLSKHVAKVCLAFDSDGAGQKALMAALEHLLPLDIEVSALDLSGGKDPDEILKSEGPDALPARLKEAIPLDEIIFRHLKNTSDLTTPFGMDNAVKTCEHYFAMLSSPVVRNRYWELAAQRLRLPPEVLYAEVRRLKTAASAEEYRKNRYAEVKQLRTASRTDDLSSGARSAIKILLELALADRDCARNAALEAPSSLLERSMTGKALSFVSAFALNEEWDDLKNQISKLPDEVADDETVAGLLASECRFPADTRTRVCEECLRRLSEEARHLRRAELMKRLKEASGTPGEREIFDEIMRLDRESAEIRSPEGN